jgi:hypothetical protein
MAPWAASTLRISGTIAVATMKQTMMPEENIGERERLRLAKREAPELPRSAADAPTSWSPSRPAAVAAQCRRAARWSSLRCCA